MRFRFTLDHDIEGPLQISEPDGWKGAKTKLERDEQFFSLIEHYEGSAGGAFTFYGDDGVHDGGVSYLKNIEETYGFDANINFLAEFAPDDTNYQQIFEGLLELSGKNEMKDNKMQVPVIRDDFWAKFINRIDTPVNMSDLTDIDGNAVDACPPVSITMTPQVIQKSFYGIYDFPTWISIPAANGYIQTTPDTIELDEIGFRFGVSTYFNSLLPSWVWDMEEAGEYTFDIRIIMSGAAIDTSAPADPTLQAVASLWDWKLQHNDIVYTFNKTDFTAGSQDYTEYTLNVSLGMSANDVVRIYGEEISNVYNAFTIWGKQGANFLYTPPNPDEYPTLPNTTGHDIPSYIRVTGQTTYPETTTQGYLIHDLIHGVLARLGLGTDPFYSEFLGGLLTNTKQYDADGCGWMYVVKKGLQIRQYSLVEKPFFISFKQIWDGINPILNLGLAYETLEGSPDHQVIRIEQKAYFVEDTTSITFSNVRDISSSYDQSYIFKTIKTGYRQWQAENIAGNDDFATKQTRATRFVKTGIDLNLESDFIAAGYAIETTRRTTREKSADYKYDNNNFIIAINADDVSPDVYRPELDENYDSVTGLINSTSRYNLILSPMRSLLRWANYIGGCLQSYATSSYKFVSGEGNYDMVSDYSCGSGNQCQAIICDPLGESQDISLTSYNGVFGYFFLPLLYDIRIPMEWEEYETIRDNPTKAIGISQTNTGHVAFKIKILEYDIVNAQASIKAWPKTFFPINVIESVPEMACGIEVGPVYEECYQNVLDYAESL